MTDMDGRGDAFAGDSESGEERGGDHREAHIRERAYRIWESENRPDGRHEEHWTQAARELGDEDGGDAGAGLSDAGRTEALGRTGETEGFGGRGVAQPMTPGQMQGSEDVTGERPGGGRRAGSGRR